MYCINCGEQLNKDAKFCHACGTEQILNENLPDELQLGKAETPRSALEALNEYEQQSLLENQINDEESNHTLVTDTQFEQEMSKDEALRLFVYENASVYFKRWRLESGEVPVISWNWAAFFLTYIWAGYRKMYGLIFIPLAISLILHGSIYVLLPFEFSFIVGLGTAFFYGLFGNYFYYKYALKKIEKCRGVDGDYSKQLLMMNGGTSGIGIFIAIISALAQGVILLILAIIIFAVGSWSEAGSLFGYDGNIEFGYDQSSGEIIMPSNEFTPDDIIHYSFYFPDGRGGDYTIILEKIEDISYIYDSWDDRVPPDWEGLVNSMYAPVDEGEYLMKIVKDDEVIAKGTFYISEELSGGGGIEEF